MENKKRVVVIDDEVDLGALIKKILERTERYCVEVAHNGQEGQQLCMDVNPDLILLDMIMPKVNGYEVLQFLKKQEKESKIPVIVMSGLGEEEELIEALRRDVLNVDDIEDEPVVLDKNLGQFSIEEKSKRIAQRLGVAVYLCKPFSKEILLKIIKQVLREE